MKYFNIKLIKMKVLQLFKSQQFSRYFSVYKVVRQDFKVLQQEDIQFFKSFMKENQIQQDDLQHYNTDWTKKFIGNSKLVLFPNTEEQISQILKYAQEQKLAIVPQGGSTGMVGGGVPVFDEIILNMKNFNKIIDFNQENKILTTQPGVCPQMANDYLGQFKYELPWDLGSKGSCHIGGNVSTAAGGKYIVRNGQLRGYILGLRVVSPQGEILNYSSCIKKDNTGPDLKQLYIGSEGTLGVITQVDVLTVPVLSEKQVMFVKVDSFQKVITLMNLVQQEMSSFLTAFEYMDPFMYRCIHEHTNLKVPFEVDNTSFYVLMEFGSQKDFSDHLEEIYKSISEKELILDGILSQNEQQYKQLWELREQCAIACANKGINIKYDFSIPVQEFDNFAEHYRKVLGDKAYIVAFGHIADGDVHYNVIIKDNPDRIRDILEPDIYNRVRQLKGSISAEHGLSFEKGKYSYLCKDEAPLKYIRQIKKMFDPNLILNPYKTFV